jgi:hypothetical protein
MSSSSLLASIAMVCLVAVGLLGVAAAVGPASAGNAHQKAREHSRDYVLESKRRPRTQRIRLPIGPAYIYYDYPYYYSRGHYPTHIRPGFIYFGRPYSYYSRGYFPRYGARRYKARRN